jgi:hypothetical protein
VHCAYDSTLTEPTLNLYYPRIFVVLPTSTAMCDPTYTFLRWPHHDWPSDTLSLAERVLENDISDMERNSITALYSDYRSPSRSAQRDLRERKRQRILNPMFRTKHCAYHRDCLAFKENHLSSRRRRTRTVRRECTDDAYWERECAELDVRERVEYADLVTLYYNHGHNAAAIESLRPQLFGSMQSEEGDAHEWVSVSLPADANAESDAQFEAEPEAITTQNWTIYLYPPLLTPVVSPQSSDFRPRCDYSSETTFAFHRNATGLWELGYANHHLLSSSADPYGCTQTPLPMSCGCCSANTGFFACSCAEFPEDWRSPAEPWQGALIQWGDNVNIEQHMRVADQLHEVRQRGFGLSWRGEAQAVWKRGKDETAQHTGCEEWTFLRVPRVKSGEKDDWDVVSSLSSTGSWRIVDVT